MCKGNWWIDVLCSFIDEETEAMRFPEGYLYSLMKQEFKGKPSF